MKGFLEQYGVGIFVLVLISILIAFASPIGKTIKNDITTKVNNLEEITDEETEIAKGNYYTIVFDGNGARCGSMKPMKVICGKEFKMPKCEFSKSGANKTNIWSTKRDGSGHLYTANIIYKDISYKGKTITLYAWYGGYALDLDAYLDSIHENKSHNYGVCDVYINGELVSKSVSDFYCVYPKGTTYEIKNIHETNGHTYIGMYNNQSTSGVLSKYTKLFPMFITNTYTITYHANATDAVGTTASSHHTYDKSASLTANGFTRSGYMFLGWNTTADGSGTTYTDMQEVKNLTDQNNVNIDLYAMWQKN